MGLEQQGHSMRAQRHRERYEPTLAYVLAEQAPAAGVDFNATPGPWRATLRRHRLELISVVTNGREEIMVNNMERAVDVAGLLNWCGVDDLRPIPALRPPIDAGLAEDGLKAAG